MIVALKTDDRVLVGITICNNSVGTSDKDLTLDENLPMWKVRGEKNCYVFTDRIDYPTDILRYNDRVFKGITDGKSIIRNVVPHIRDLLDKTDNLLKGQEDEQKWNNQMVIVKDGEIFFIDDYLVVFQKSEYVATAYENYVIGTLEDTRDLDPTQRILTAFRTVGRMRNITLFPVTIFDTKTKRKTVYYQ